MDDLLALMEENSAAEAPIQASGGPENSEGSHRRLNITAPKTSEATSIASASASVQPSLAKGSLQSRAEASIDDKLGIRMVKRKLSSMDLMDLISTHPYHSTASISAMSRVALNRLLVDPAAVVSDATVSGKTHIVTVGIVFTNSGTRVSANGGRAFAVLSIGNLNTGPVLTVFLFGEAYGRHVTSCVPGTIIALVVPNLVPPKEGSTDRTISLSVNLHPQLIPVANARDYGTCKAAVRTKRTDGKWVSNGGQCKHFVDTRVSQHCPTHRKQENAKRGKVDRNKGISHLQQWKQESSAQHFVARQTAVAGSLSSRPLTRSAPVPTTVSTNNFGNGLVNNLEAMLNESSSASNPSNLRLPLHMKKTTAQVGAINRRNVDSRGACSAADRLLDRSRQPLAAANRSVGRDTGTCTAKPVHQDWLNLKQKSNKETPNVKRRTVNMDTGGFDGSVVVPKASRLFRSTGTASALRAAPVAQHSLTEAKKASILQQQRLVAEKVRSNPEHTSLLDGPGRFRRTALGTGKSRLLSSSVGERDRRALEQSLFGQLGQVDAGEMLAAKSRFANEADAEAYARSRGKLVDLERREEQKNANENKKRKVTAHAIKKEWVCKTCSCRSSSKPLRCIQARHEVQLERDVKATTSIGEKRLQLSEKSAEDGGLVLGAGLDWDRRRNFTS